MKTPITLIAITTSAVALITAVTFAGKVESYFCAVPNQADAAEKVNKVAAQPLVCTLTSKEKRDRQDEILPLLANAVISTEELEDGFVITIKNGHAHEFIEFIELERECCSFFNFTLNFPANDAPVALTVSGPAGSKAFSSKLFKQNKLNSVQKPKAVTDACCAVKK